MSPTVSYAGRPRPVRFLRRPNRYLALVEFRSNGRRVRAHVPNPGRMTELLRPGETVGWVVPANGPGRSTRWDLVVVRHGASLVSIDSRIANRVMARVLSVGPRDAPERGQWRAEVTHGDHRFDFARRTAVPGRPLALLEVKSSNWRIEDFAMFPDAPTTRGAAHLRALARAARSGIDARVVFVVQRSDVRAFSVHRLRDPEFARAF
ncbi:MAG: DNA/RNA nuclease SfsA, partial [Thermoplasmata archaeon]|nr:DNA/RNA nuclease SfsA [Thermoplasmata archaeon]